MTVAQQIITIGTVVAGTMATRFIPFLVFPPGRKTPEYIRYLGRVLPAAAISLLVIYCFRDVSIASAAVVILHLWQRKMVLSIAGGTVIYMLLIQFVF